MDNERFGASVDVEDGRYIYVGPIQSKPRYQDDFNSTIDYLKNDIVKYQDSYGKQVEYKVLKLV